MARRRQRAKQSFVYVEVPNRRRSIWYMNPPKPVEVWKCSWHGKYRRYGHNPPGCRKCQEASDRRSADLRSPPRPAYEGVAGCCSLCGRSPLPGRRRSWCSDECVLMWQLATDTNVVKQHFHGLGLRCCWSCGRTGQRFQVDHVRPLWSLSPEDRLELRWWLPFNLPTAVPAVPSREVRLGVEAATRSPAGEGRMVPLARSGDLRRIHYNM